MCDREKEMERERNTRFEPWSYFQVPIRKMKMGAQYVNRIIFDNAVLLS